MCILNFLKHCLCPTKLSLALGPTESMPPKLYVTSGSPAVRSVLLIAAASKIQLEKVEINIWSGEHLRPNYLKLNPQHTVPTLVDNNFVLWDSHAIACYLVVQYGKDDSLYPRDPRRRAVVDQRLHFDSGILYPRLRSIMVSIINQGAKSVSEKSKNRVTEAYGFLEAFLEGKQWLAGNSLTVADLCCVSSVSTLDRFVPIPETRFPKIRDWFRKCQSLPYYNDANQKGLDTLMAFVNLKLNKDL